MARPESTLHVRWRRGIGVLRHSWLPGFVGLWLVAYAVLLSFFFRNVLIAHNYLEIFPGELVFPLLMHALTATCITASLFWLSRLRTFSVRLVSVAVLALLVIGYDSGLVAVADGIRAFTPGLSEGDPLAAVSVVYMLILYGMAVAAGTGFQHLQRRYARLDEKNVRFGVLVAVGYVFLVPAISLFGMLPTLIQESHVTAPELPVPARRAAVTDKPDIYYIVLDRYTSDTVLREQFGYDNSAFSNFLREHDFTVSDNAASNYPSTPPSIASTLNASYLSSFTAPFTNNTVQSRTLYYNLARQGSVIKALTNNGYMFHSIGSIYGMSNRAPLAYRDHMYERELQVFGKRKRLRGIESTSFLRSPYYRFANIRTPWWPLKVTERDPIGYVRDQLNILDDLADDPQQGGRFIFVHILVPHDPFYFNADGSASDHPETGNNGAPLKQKYLGQVQFITGQMQQSVTKIMQHSAGQAVVILNADEGPYPQVMNTTIRQTAVAAAQLEGDGLLRTDARKWPEDWVRMKFGIQQAVHIPQATPEDMQHLSSVNVFRIVLNRYLGYELPYLPECHYGPAIGTVRDYVYADLTPRLVAHPDAVCSTMQTLSSVSK